MKKYIAAITLVGALVLVAQIFGADKSPDSTSTAPVKLHAQTNCPVMGGKIDSTYYTDIQGQRVYHCCPKCSAKLKADPDKYFKKAAADGVLFQNIQKICPVSGEDLEGTKFYTDYQGRRILFCCNKCKKSFAANPTKYLAMIDQPADSTTQKNEKMDMH